ncbi:hypothetical protein [Kocuria arenosa]|uniref:hypothetical protein n=1 Tax=Kocuria arenosa TaxID=3071446 RepID=UPI0034D42AF4
MPSTPRKPIAAAARLATPLAWVRAPLDAAFSAAVAEAAPRADEELSQWHT